MINHIGKNVAGLPGLIVRALEESGIEGEYYYGTEYNATCPKPNTAHTQGLDEKNIFGLINYLNNIRQANRKMSFYYAGSGIYSRLVKGKLYIFGTGSDFYSSENVNGLIYENSIKGWLMRDAVNRAEGVFYCDPNIKKHAEAHHAKKTIHIPNPIFLEDFKKYDGEEPFKDFTVLAPARQLWYSKGNDILIKGFAKFILSGGTGKLLWSYYAEDKERTRELIKTLGIESYCEALPLLPKDELLRLYSKVDVIIDHFIYGALSIVGFDALAMGKPLITYINPTQKAVYDEELPLTSVNTPETISSALTELYHGNKPRDSINWVKKYHSPERAANLIIKELTG